MEEPKKPDDDANQFSETRKLWRQLAFALIGMLLPFSGYAAFQLFEIFNAHREADLAFRRLDAKVAQMTRQSEEMEKVLAVLKHSKDRIFTCTQPIVSLLQGHLLENQKQDWKSPASCRSESRADLGRITAYKNEDYPLIKNYAESVAEVLTTEGRIWDELDTFLESRFKSKQASEEDFKQLSTFLAKFDSLMQASSSLPGGATRMIGKIGDAQVDVELEIQGVLAKLASAKQKFMLYLTGLVVSGIVLAWSVLQIIRPREFQPKKPKLILPE
jgi:hypothetical protein